MEQEERVVLLMRDGRAFLHYTDADGDVVWLSFRKEAEGRIAAAIIRSRIDLPCPDPDITFSKFTGLYIEKHLIEVCAQETLKNTRSWIRCKLLPYFGDMRLADIDAEVLKAFQHCLSEDSTNRSVNRVMDVLSSMLTKAVHWRYLKANPALRVDELAR